MNCEGSRFPEREDLMLLISLPADFTTALLRKYNGFTRNNLPNVGLSLVGPLVGPTGEKTTGNRARRSGSGTYARTRGSDCAGRQERLIFLLFRGNLEKQIHV